MDQGEREPERELEGRPFAVIVLGDLGRSPRMQNHALALAAHGASVRLIGLAGSSLQEAVFAHPHIKVTRLAGPGSGAARGPLLRLLIAGWRISRLSLALFRLLVLKGPRGETQLMQSPPLIPVWWIAQLGRLLRDARPVIDWHNLGHTVLALAPGMPAWLVACYRWLEERAARQAQLQFAVTSSLAARIAATTITLPDAPVAAHQDRAAQWAPGGIPEGARLVIVPSSWSADDDFELLTEALQALKDRAGCWHFLVTGDGPRLPQLGPALLGLAGGGLSIQIVWLDYEAYLGALRICDLGLSVHRSSSDADLPIKLLDMVAAGLPVAALCPSGPVVDFIAATEAAQGFRDAGELVGILTAPLPERGFSAEVGASWESVWSTTALPRLAEVSA